MGRTIEKAGASFLLLSVCLSLSARVSEEEKDREYGPIRTQSSLIYDPCFLLSHGFDAVHFVTYYELPFFFRSGRT